MTMRTIERQGEKEIIVFSRSSYSCLIKWILQKNFRGITIPLIPQCSKFTLRSSFNTVEFFVVVSSRYEYNDLIQCSYKLLDATERTFKCTKTVLGHAFSFYNNSGLPHPSKE